MLDAETTSFIPYDPSFGAGGTLADYAPSFHYRLGLTALGDGRFLLAGFVRAEPSAALKLAVARYTADGRVDPAFGTGGVALLGQGPSVATMPNVEVAVQPDGRILVAAVFQLPSQEQRWSLWRLTSAGQLDESFSGDGRLQISFPGEPRLLHLAAVLVGADNSILVVGTGPDSTLCVARYRPTGALDLGFGTDGKLMVKLPGERAFGLAAALDAEGNLVVAGLTTMPDSGADMLVGRLRPDGTPDPTFGLAGFVVEDFGIRSDSASCVRVQPDGRIVVAGSADVNATGSAPALMRLLPDGRLDSSFGTGGLVRLTTGKEPDSIGVSALELLPGERLAVAGSYRITDSEQKDHPLYRVPQPFVAVLDRHGRADQNFDGDRGLVFLGAGSPTAPTALVAAGQKVLVGANQALLRLNTTTDFAALRLTIGADENPAGPGPLRFFVTVHNDGESAAGGLIKLRASKAVAVEASTGGSYVVAPNRVDVVGKVLGVAPGKTATLTLRTTVTGFEELITLQGSIGSGPDLNPVDNHASISVAISKFPTI